MLDIKIYQINSDRDFNRLKFLRYELLEKYQGSPDVNSGIYDKVWSGTVDAKTLEDVYQIFNVNHPKDFTGHSLSVSDVVEVIDKNNEFENTSNFYFCDSFGFKRIEFDPEKCVIARNMAEEEKKNKVTLWARLGVSIDVTKSELEVLNRGDDAAQSLLKNLIQSDRCYLDGDTYFPGPANEDLLTYDLSFDYDKASLQKNIESLSGIKQSEKSGNIDEIISNAASRTETQTNKNMPDREQTF